MHAEDQVRMAMSNLYHRKLRTLLTVLGVTVGTTLVVVVISLGLGMNAQQDEMISQMGDLTKITVYPGGYSGQEGAAVLNDDAVAGFEAISGVEMATPMYHPQGIQGAFYAGEDLSYKMDLHNVVGMYPEAMEKMGYNLLEGEYPQGKAAEDEPISVLVGEFTDFAFYDISDEDQHVYRWPELDEEGNLLQQPFVEIATEEIAFKSTPLDEEDPDSPVVTREIQMVGRVEEDYNKGWETSQGIIMSIEDVKALEQAYNDANKIKPTPQEQNRGYESAVVYVESMELVEEVDAVIKEMGFETYSLESIREPLRESVQQQQMFLGMLGGVSLVVAALGITNTMYMSIYERTREIGVMKVLGCQVGSIRSMFLLEAGFIGFLGGCLGAALSKGVSFAINHFGLNLSGGGMSSGMIYMGDMGSSGASSSIVPLWLLGLAVGFASVIGLLAGIPPSLRATKISALEALRQV